MHQAKEKISRVKDKINELEYSDINKDRKYKENV